MKKMFTQKKFLVVIPVILIIGWLSWSKLAPKKQTTAEVQTAPVEKGTLVVSVSSSGQVASTNSKSATTNVSGVVKNVFVQNGSVVKSGDKLVEIDLDQESKQTYTQALASYQSAKNSLASAQASQYSLQAAMFGKWDTYKTLSETDTYKDTNSPNRDVAQFNIPQKEWLAAEAQYKNQQAVVAAANTSLSSASQSLRLSSPIIYAPIGGTVSGLSLMKGTVISSGNSDSSTTSTGQTIASITTEALPTVSVNLTEIDVTKVSVGDKVTITLDALPDKTYTGKVMSIDTIGAVSSGVTSYPAVIVFDTDAPEVYANMSVQANIITDTKDNVILIPTSSIQTQNGSSSVRVMKDGKQTSTQIQTGLSSGTQTEVVSGLSEGDTIVTSAAQSTTTSGSSSQTRSPFSGLGGGGGLGGGNAVRFSR